MFARLKRAGYRTGGELDDEWIITDATGSRQVAVGRHGGAFYVRGSGPSPVHGSIAKVEATIKIRLQALSRLEPVGVGLERHGRGPGIVGGAAPLPDLTPRCHPDLIRAPRRDEVEIKIAGKKHWLWRAVDQDGTVLDVLVQSRRDKRAAKRLLRKLLKRQGRPPRVMVTELLWLQSKAA